MLNVLITGYRKMGRMIVKTTEQSDDMKVVMVIDGTSHPDISTLQEHVNIIVNFSHSDDLTQIKPFVLECACAYICGTTGHNGIQKCQVGGLSSMAPIVFQTNFSLGIAAFQEVLQMITPVLEESSDMEAMEKHHDQKRNTPSGTTKMPVATMNREHTHRGVHGRNGFVGKRRKEVDIYAMHGGIVTEGHGAYSFGDDEIFEIRHTANSRKILVNEALRAARFTAIQKPSMCIMEGILLA